MKPVHAIAAMSAGAALLYFLKPKPPGQAQRIDIPPDPIPGPGPGPSPSGLGQLSTLSLVPGGQYAAVVNIGAPLSWLASASKVASQAGAQGFTSVSVSETRPPGFPGSAQGDYYVSGVYQGAPKTMARSHAGGAITIVDAWRTG